jgi:hypothetical protein
VGRGPGRGGARRLRPAVLDASPRRPAPSRREAARKGVTRAASGAHPRRDLALDLAGLGEAAQLLLRKDQIVTDGNLKDAAAALDQPGLDAELPFDFGRQTGGTGIVVSTGTVLDGDLARHALLLSAAIIEARAGPPKGDPARHSLQGKRLYP